MTNKGLLIIISSPSGNGKDAVINALLNIIPGSSRFITTTSRPPRPGNQEGVDYHFVTEQKFKEKIKNNDFLEYNFYAGNYYGTEKKLLDIALSKNNITFLNMDVNGKDNINKAGIKNLSIFLLPENLEILKNRIKSRGGISNEIIEERMKIAQKEISFAPSYDYQVVNENGKLDQTVDKLAKIITFELTKSPNIDK